MTDNRGDESPVHHTPQAAAALVTFLDVRKRGAGGHVQSRFLRQDVV